MHSFIELKQELLNHLYSIDKGKMSIQDLKTYTEIIDIVKKMEESNNMEPWFKLMDKMTTSSFNSSYKPVDIKEG